MPSKYPNASYLFNKMKIELEAENLITINRNYVTL